MSKKPYFILFVFVLLLVSAIIFNSLGFLENREGKEPELQETDESNTSAVRLLRLEGQVEYRERDADWQPVQEEIVLGNDYMVKVTDEGKAAVKLDDDSVVRLNSDSHLVLADISPDKIVFSDVQGEMYFRIVTDKRIFEIRTEDVVYEIHGTACKIVNKEEEKAVEVYQGEVKLKEKDKEETVLEEGQRFCFKNAQEPEEENQTEDISQEELAEDEFLAWNKQQDLENEVYQNEPAVLENGEQEGIRETEMIQDSSLGVKSILLSHSGNSAVSWQVDGYSSQGFKLLWSKNTNPSFPARDRDKYRQFDSPDASSAVINAFDGKGIYYVRVCERLGEDCGVYSNEIEVELNR